MQRLKALDELTPADLWREVPCDDEGFWSDARERQLHLVKTLIEEALEEEMTLLQGAGRYRRTEDRHGHRNGFYVLAVWMLMAFGWNIYVAWVLIAEVSQ